RAPALRRGRPPRGGRPARHHHLPLAGRPPGQALPRRALRQGPPARRVRPPHRRGAARAAQARHPVARRHQPSRPLGALARRPEAPVERTLIRTDVAVDLPSAPATPAVAGALSRLIPLWRYAVYALTLFAVLDRKST